MLEFTQGDMFDVAVDIRVNTVNCVGVMGAGVALAFRQRYPDMFKDYQKACKDGRVRPGRMHVWKPLSGDWVVNFPTKRDWRDPSCYEDIEAGLDDLRDYLKGFGSITVALPALGCGHGGLDWARVSAMIDEKLGGLDAHIFVFGPSASRRAGHSANAGPTDDERASASQLGYKLAEATRWPNLQATNPLFVLGSETPLQGKWIALMPSRAPAEREMQALESIAAEIARLDSGSAVALVHSGRVSEDIAQVFAGLGIDVVLLLPFGVLTRKAIAKNANSHGSRRSTLVSEAPPNSKWSRQFFAQAQEMLRSNAAAMLLSDSTPDWLIDKGLGKWAKIPISYVRYESMTDHVRESLAEVGARSIGRRGEDGTPKIDHLLSALAGTTGHDRKPDDHPEAAEPDRADRSGEPKMLSPVEAITITLDNIPIEERHEFLDLLERVGADDAKISFRVILKGLSSMDRHRLEALRRGDEGE